MTAVHRGELRQLSAEADPVEDVVAEYQRRGLARQEVLRK